MVMNNVEPFVSSKDIYAGTRWQLEISAQLESTNFGIVCVTKENQRAPWLNFEAGALAKAVDASRVIPLAIDLKPSDIELPLGQFQAQSADAAGVTEICRAINGSMQQALDPNLLVRAVTKWWPDLEADLASAAAKASTPTGSRSRSERELLEEVLNTVRDLARNAPSKGVGVSSVLSSSHPVVAEIRDVLTKSGLDDFKILFGTNRRIGIGGTEVDPSTREQIRICAEPYGVKVQFVAAPPNRRRGTQAEDDDEVGASAE